MRKSEEKEVDGKRYIFNQYQTEKGLELLAYITVIAAEPLAKFFPYIPEEGKKDVEIPEEVYGEVANAFSKNLDPKKFSRFCSDLMAGTNIVDVINRPINFNEDFAGDYGHLIMVIKEMISFQFGNVFQKLAGITPASLAREGARVIQAK